MKKFKRCFNLLLKAGSTAFEDSSVGPVLSPFLLKDKVSKFCVEFNNVTNYYPVHLLLRVKFFLYVDNSFFFSIKGPSFFNLFKIFLNLNKFNNLDDFLFLTEVFDIIFLKFFFLKKNFYIILF